MALSRLILILAILCAVNGSLTRSCSGDGVEIRIAVQRDFLTFFKDADVGPCGAGAACKLYCSESFLWWDFLELVNVSEHLLGITLLYIANGFDLLLHVLHIR